ncbi:MULTISPECIES: YkvA family protein [Paenibacillus]|uniref:YkvA family protein n=1 Tax=Paenibacillus TaxID=44249 RepID=UPI0022B881A9|nr:YkvA family protein [Paenibacillus caseinilyticus]MCZ8522260.1 YkvA family protein [Paenibacillus caseinilyticus]
MESTTKIGLSEEQQKAIGENMTKYEKHYSEEGFWAKIAKYAKLAGEAVVHAGLLLFYALKSPKTPTRAKMQIYGALGYLILPVDLIPDFILGMGFLDDWGALALAVKSVSSAIDDEVKRQAKEKVEELFGGDTEEGAGQPKSTLS